LGWIGVLPVTLLNTVTNCGFGASICPTLTGGAGSTFAGIAIVTSFIAMVLDASSHCCCKSAKGGLTGGGGTTIIITGAHQSPAPMAHHAAATYWRKTTDGKETWSVPAPKQPAAKSPRPRKAKPSPCNPPPLPFSNRFVQDGTGQTAWTIPAGGVLVG